MKAGKAKPRQQAGSPVQRVDVAGIVERSVRAMADDLVKMLQPTDEVSSIAGSYMSHEDPKVRRLAGFVLSRDLTAGPKR